MLNAKNILHEWVNRFNKQYDTKLKFDENTLIYPFSDNELTMIQVLDDSEEFFVATPICPIPDDKNDQYQLYENILKLNKEQSIMLNGNLSIDDDKQLVLLCHFYNITQLTPNDIEGLLGKARYALAQIRKKLGLSNQLQKLDTEFPLQAPLKEASMPINLASFLKIV
ncbi:CesT family type III secretion system chaperone [uncultured Shewanella sp.]|uniref:CesT family type III secretion system chaperone n=1 Tax=uncultured Shewanella sp. TaxID=173975 RepID=UPI0026260F7B|nr:CesT family type III secretion system chaperone [uncultured Shewanella sp.]